MAILTNDTLSLNNLAAATGQTTKSLSAAKGDTNGPIAMSSFGIDAVNEAIQGYRYLVEDTTDSYSVAFVNPGSNINRIASNAANFTWSMPTNGGLISINANPNGTAQVTVGSMNPQTPGDQNTLELRSEHVIRVKFADGFNDHATRYNTNIEKTIYAVDSYDGNSLDLCLTLDTPILLADGTYVGAGDLEEGMVLKGTQFDGLEEFDNSNYINWASNMLLPKEEDVTILGLVYGFAEKIYKFNDGLIKATMEHPFLIKQPNGFYKFKRAHLIETTDVFIQFIDGEYTETSIHNIEVIEEPTEIVTIDVDGSNIYFANNVVSHNKDEGNSHTDFNPPFEPNTVRWDTFQQKLLWDIGHDENPREADSIVGNQGSEIQWSDNSDFSTIEGTLRWGDPIQEYGILEQWSPHVTDLDSTLTGPAEHTLQYYFRVRNIGNGNLKSGWVSINETSVDGGSIQTANNPKVTIGDILG